MKLNSNSNLKYRLFLSFEEISIVLFFNDEQITDDSWTQSD